MTFIFVITTENQFRFHLYFLPNGQTNPVNPKIEFSIVKVPFYLYFKRLQPLDILECFQIRFLIWKVTAEFKG